MLGFLNHIGWDFANGQFVIGVIFVGVSLHCDKVNNTANVFFEADWQVNSERILAQALVNRFERLVEVATYLVNLVDEADAWHAVFVGLAPDSFGLSFNTHLAIEDYDSTVKHAK